MKSRGVTIREFGLVLLCLAGLADAFFLYIEEDRGTVGQFCEAVMGASGAGCEQVLTSRYAQVAGLKLTLVGILYYVSLFWLAIWARTESARGNGRPARVAAAGLSGAGLILSGYLTYLQAAVIKAWCPFCIGSAALTTLIFVLAVWNLLASRERGVLPRAMMADAGPDGEELVAAGETVEVEPSMWIGALVLLCVFLSAGLVIVLMVKAPEPAPSALENMMKYVPRRTTPPGGAAYGSDSAPVTVQAFLDYTCNHCRLFENEVFPKIRENYIRTGKVRWIARVLPHSDEGAPLFFSVAAICGRRFSDSALIEEALFAYPIPAPKSGFDALVDALTTGGVDTATIQGVTNCMLKEGAGIRDLVIVEVQQAFSYGLKGPPAFVIDGIAFQGSMDYQNMAGIIEQFLKDRGL